MGWGNGRGIVDDTSRLYLTWLSADMHDSHALASNSPSI